MGVESPRIPSGMSHQTEATEAAPSELRDVLGVAVLALLAAAMLFVVGFLALFPLEPLSVIALVFALLSFRILIGARTYTLPSAGPAFSSQASGCCSIPRGGTSSTGRRSSSAARRPSFVGSASASSWGKISTCSSWSPRPAGGSRRSWPRSAWRRGSTRSFRAERGARRRRGAGRPDRRRSGAVWPQVLEGLTAAAGGHQRNSPAPQTRPPPKAAHSTMSSAESSPDRLSSSRAMGTEAAEVLP